MLLNFSTVWSNEQKQHIKNETYLLDKSHSIFLIKADLTYSPILISSTSNIKAE